MVIVAGIKADLVVNLSSKSPTPDSFALPLEYIPCINYPVLFKKNQAKIQVSFYFDNKLNIIFLVYAINLTCKSQSINIKAQKIDGSIF